eukprot:scaffold422987_cov55-Attheya_sp.AAC.4
MSNDQTNASTTICAVRSRAHPNLQYIQIVLSRGDDGRRGALEPNHRIMSSPPPSSIVRRNEGFARSLLKLGPTGSTPETRTHMHQPKYK